MKTKEEILASLKKKTGSKSTVETTKLSDLEATLKFDLSSSSESNNSIDAEKLIRPAAGSTIKSNKMKKSVAVREAARMKLVQQHPSFQENPIMAINLHLQQMLKKKELVS